MKEIYTKPEIKIVKLRTEDIMQTSNATEPTDIIGGEKAQSLGTTSYSDIFAK